MSITLFEIKEIESLSVPFIVLCITAVIVLPLVIFVFCKTDLGAKLLFGFIDLFLLFVICSVIYSEHNYYKCVYDEYKRGNAEIIEGTVHDYVVEKDFRGPDYFMINEEDFSLAGETNGSYYKQSEGGLIDNGVHLKIWYIRYREENCIARIDMIQ